MLSYLLDIFRQLGTYYWICTISNSLLGLAYILAVICKIMAANNMGEL